MEEAVRGACNQQAESIPFEPDLFNRSAGKWSIYDLQFISMPFYCAVAVERLFL